MQTKKVKSEIEDKLQDTEELIIRHEREVLRMAQRPTPGSIRDELLYEKGVAKGLRTALTIINVFGESDRQHV